MPSLNRNEKVPCPKCSKLVRKADISRHLKSLCGKAICSICNMEVDCRHLQRHLKTHDNTYRCQLSPKFNTDTKDNLYIHIIKQHSNLNLDGTVNDIPNVGVILEDDEAPAANPLQCTICINEGKPPRNYATKSSLRRHKRMIHVGQGGLGRKRLTASGTKMQQKASTLSEDMYSLGFDFFKTYFLHKFLCNNSLINNENMKILIQFQLPNMHFFPECI